MMTGQMSKLIIIRAFTIEKIATGQEIKVWSDMIQLFGNVRYITGNESYQVNQRVATKKIIVTIYSRMAEFTEQNQIVFEGNTYSIISITPTEDEFYLEIEVESYYRKKEWDVKK